jgi:glycosyltransferase involved in cell wall biosynthesis
MRIVHMVWGAGFGGIERFVSDLARVQTAAGQEVGVVVCGAGDGDPSLERYASPGVAVTSGRLHSGFDLRPAALRVIAKQVCAYDVVHLHGFAPGVAMALELAGRAIVFTEHGLLGLGARWPSRAAIKQAAKGSYLRTRVGAVACVSEWIAAAVCEKYGVPPERVHHVPDGASLDSIRPSSGREEILRQENVDPATWVMTVTARLVAFKRVDRLLHAAARLEREGPDWVLLVAGGGPLEAVLRKQAVSLGIGAHVRFLGFRTDPWDLVAAADVVPMPSELEPFGLVVLEAMALGRPVLVFADSGGPAEIIRTVGGGCVAETLEEYAAALQQSRAGVPVAGMRALDLDLFKKTYSIQTAAAIYAKLYEAAVADRSLVRPNEGR